MSCWMISDDHADALVSAYRRVSGQNPYAYSTDDLDMLTDSELGQMLLNECNASVHHRYNEAGYLPDVMIYVIAGYRHREMTMPINPTTLARAISAARCYEYQACEHPGWEASDAKQWIDRLIKRCCDALERMLAGGCWGVDDRKYFTATTEAA